MLYGSGKYIYELLEDWAKLPKGWSFSDVPQILIDKRDRVYVLTRSVEHPIIVLDREGNFLYTYGEGEFDEAQIGIPLTASGKAARLTRAHGGCLGPDGSLYCTDDFYHVVLKLSSEGKLLMTLGTKGKPSDTGYRKCSSVSSEAAMVAEEISTITRGGPPFNKPTGVALSSSSEIYVSDGYGNARVHKFTANGTLLFSWGEPGGRPGQFRFPHCVRTDKWDRVWVADRENNRIQIFDAQGKFLNEWTDLVRPINLCFDNEGSVYCSEMCKRISIFTTDGKLLARWGNEGHPLDSPLFISPHAVAVDSKGDLYVGMNAMTVARAAPRFTSVRKFARKN